MESVCFSVLMSVYAGTCAADLHVCLLSIKEQTLSPDEIILIKDGPVDSALDKCIAAFTKFLPIRTHAYPVNRGLGIALRDGLLICKNELVARVDSDDRCLPDRFSQQISFMINNPEISAVGGFMRELYESRGQIISAVRQVPVDPKTIISSAKKRNPINHPTVMFRKKVVIDCGNYQNCPYFEDYFLWARLLESGCNLANLPVVLVETEIDSAYFERRGGINYIFDEVRLARKLYSIGFFSLIGIVWFLLIRLPVRLTPYTLRSSLYRYLLRTRRTIDHAAIVSESEHN